MPIAKVRKEFEAPSPAGTVTPRAVQLDPIVAAPSPARALQDQLASRTQGMPAADPDKWSPRRSLALIVSASAALWMAILMAGVEATKILA